MNPIATVSGVLMELDVSAVPFLVLIALGLIALLVSFFLRALVDRRIQAAQRVLEESENSSSNSFLSSDRPESFWLRYGDTIKRSIHSLAWTLVGLGVLNFVSYALIEVAERFAKHPDGSMTSKMVDDIDKLSHYIKQGADVMLRIVVVIVAGVWVARFFHGAMRGLLLGGLVAGRAESHSRVKARTETLLTSSGYAINVAVFIVCALMALHMLGVSVTPLLATAGVASVAIGFGAQSLVRDLLAGFFILFEDQFAVGDVVSIEGRSGTVESLTLRLTKIRLGDGSLYMIPNGEIKRIENSTSGFSQIDYRVSVVVGEQIDAARVILSAELARLAKDFPQQVIAPPELLGIDTIKNSSVSLRAKVRTRPGQQWILERELNQRVISAFIEAHIQLPPNAGN